MTKILKDEGAREPFRPKLVVDDVARITKDTKNFDYKLVIYNYKDIPNNVPEHEKMGYEVVYSTEHVEDDRAFSPGQNKEESLRPKPVLKRTKDGYDMVLMRISKERAKENAIKRAKETEERQRRQSKAKVTKKVGQVEIDGGEINYNLNPNGDINNE